jgi:arylsulfatase A-like enzyme
MRRDPIDSSCGTRAWLVAVFCLIAWCLSAWPAAGVAAPPPNSRPPNFIVLLTDDQRWDALGVVQREQGDRGRFPWLATPNLDRLAAGGVRFRNAFVVNALCAPSRASLVTGQYGHVNGVTNNHTPHPVGNISVAALLRPAGYVSGYFGKWHHGRQSGTRPGFDTSASFVGQGSYFDCPIEVDGVTTPSTGFVDDVTTDYAATFIKANKDRPFLMMLGFKTCHGPFTPPPRQALAYEGAEARRVPNLDAVPPYKPTAAAAGKRGASSPESATVPTNLGMFRGINAVDDNVGRLLDLLDELKLADDTVVIFSSDNGYYLGEHTLGDKRSAYEESMRVPMLVRYPRLVPQGRTDDRIVLNIDPAATLLDLAGQPVPAAIQGRSWKPLLENRPNTPWRNSFFYCYFFEENQGTPTTTAVRTADAKLIKYPGHDDWTEVFDLRRDPYETTNLAADPAQRELRRRLEAEYDEQAAAIGFRIPDFADTPPLDGLPVKKKKRGGGKRLEPAADRDAPAADREFTDLFNGHDLDGWVAESHADSESHPDGRPVWSARDGELVCDGRGFGFLRYAREPFADFTLRLEFQLQKPAGRRSCNSGIGLRTVAFDERRSQATRPSIRGYELQLLDEAEAAPSTHACGALYRYVAPREHALGPSGDWNTLEVAMIGPRIRVTLNDRVIHDVDQFEVLAIRSKPLSGFIALQNHGGPARFRNLRVRREAGAIPGAADLEAQAAIVRSRDPKIGIRGVLRFAVEAAGRGWNAEAVEEALALARSMQVVEPADSECGNFRWRLGDEGVRDANAVEFAGQLLAVLRLEDDGRLVPRPVGRRLTPRSRELVEAMARDALPLIRRHAVQPGHTNIRLMRIWNLLALGDLAEPDARPEGEAAWREWFDFTRTNGLTEFLCPTYLGVSLDSLALIADHAPGIDTRVEADEALGYAWRTAAAHWFGPAQRLSGPHARDYDYLYGRGYADEHFADAGWLTAPPRAEGAGWLPEAPRGSLQVFRAACRSEPPAVSVRTILEEVPRFVVERTGTHAWQRITNYVGRSATIGVAGDGRGAEDKTLVVNLPAFGDRGAAAAEPFAETPNVTLVFDGRHDPYGLDHVPAGAAGHRKPHHLRPYVISSQQGPRVTAAWYLDPRRPAFGVDPESLSCLEAHLLIPTGCDVWSVESRLGADAELSPESIAFLRGGDGTALAIRVLPVATADLGPATLRLVADGGREPVQRLTATFAAQSPERGALLPLDLELRESLDDAAFAAFRREFAGREVTARLDGTRFTVLGALPLELEMGAPNDRPRRVAFAPTLSAGELLLVNGRDVASWGPAAAAE